ncbi:MAG: DUF2723 domain-containing protein [Muribaculaceae bacterium]|nr:DUF2723 domain-containing protein [Muribaculaceae bacterium]
MISKKYQLINNVGGWFVFAVALITYWLTLEPTASYWDCGEFIIQADKLEVGHPPGNPIFMLTARFFANFASDPGGISLMVNAMSGLLSALTILLLFWTITHLVRRLVVKDGQRKEISVQQMVAIMGSGLVGSLAYCWSDTFWFSAVEGEVYAFSSFCTALVFWLILKWENRADEPHSDRYLILIAYVIGVSIAVHLLNLLCIPAIVLVFAYRKWKDMNLVKSLLTLAVSFVIIVLVLYGLVPGFIKVAQQFELLFVNGFHMSFNSGTLFYAFFTVAVFFWALWELARQKNGLMIRVSFLAALAVSGIFFFGDGFIFGFIILAILGILMFTKYGKNLPVRVMTVAMWSIAVIFVGYSSYALILIRSSADTPMNQNSPDNVFDLASYLNREQYGENPLLYGETLYSSPQKELTGVARDTVSYREDGSPVILATPYYSPVIKPGKALYSKGVKGVDPVSEYGFLSQGEMATNHANAQRDGDYYVKRDYKPEARMNPELNMLFPRIYSRQHRDYYAGWVNLDTMPDQLVGVSAIDPSTGDKIPELDLQREPNYNQITGSFAYPEKYVFKPSFSQNLKYFFNYQLNHMYLRYFMWNFAGRQNDINNQFGELDAGNWISGIPVIDNARLGDQSLLPEDLGKGNAGHNVYFMLPLILGVIGLIWQSFAGKRGIEQFWVVFFLFFMTGIAIVLYLNQPPNQPRERDYAFAGSFYAFAIWIGMGVAALWRILVYLTDPERKKKGSAASDEEELQLSSIVEEPARLGKASRYCAVVATIIGLVIPFQMVSQTWDDHDRSGRFAARDYAINYLNSLEPNAIVFCNGDNDTFPLWYVQEVEGVRPDVRIVNLSYLNSDWYANQMRQQAYDSAPVDFTATPADYAYGRNDVTILGRESAPADLLTSLKMVYSGEGRSTNGYPTMPSSVVSIPVNKKAVLERGLVAAKDTADIVDNIIVDLRGTNTYRSKGYLSLGEILMLDIVATNAANGWKRPIYWVATVGDDYHVGLTPYMRSTGMAHQLVPTLQDGLPARADKAYEVVRNYRWGGADTDGEAPYFDETARRMLLTTRSTMLDAATELVYQGDINPDSVAAKEDFRKALEVVDLLSSKLGENTASYGVSIASTLGQIYGELGQKERLDDETVVAKGRDILYGLLQRYAPYLAYNREVAMSFGNASLTMESRNIPYQYYRFIELYESFGGDRKKVTALLQPLGFTVEDLQKNYERAYGRSTGGSGDYTGSSMSANAATIDSYAEEIAKYCEIANELSALSAEEYAARTADERMIDSMLYKAIEYYHSVGGTDDALRKYDNYNRLDMQRTQRLNEEYSRRHPEFGM